MGRLLIPVNAVPNKAISKYAYENGWYLEVSEFFSNTIQGENFVGYPAVFLRLKGCTLRCKWCDTQAVWKKGNKYEFSELFTLMEQNGVVEQLRSGHRLVFTGGSPLMQQAKLFSFVATFVGQFNFKPYIEVENECMLMPLPEFVKLVDCWNNSPKLSNSGNSRERINLSVIGHMSQLDNSWFKFVITSEEDWYEIQKVYLDFGVIRRDQVILMPRGATKEELDKNRENVVRIAIRESVRFSDRLHVTIWDNKGGI